MLSIPLFFLCFMSIQTNKIQNIHFCQWFWAICILKQNFLLHFFCCNEMLKCTVARYWCICWCSCLPTSRRWNAVPRNKKIRFDLVWSPVWLFDQVQRARALHDDSDKCLFGSSVAEQVWVDTINICCARCTPGQAVERLCQSSWPFSFQIGEHVLILDNSPGSEPIALPAQRPGLVSRCIHAPFLVSPVFYQVLIFNAADRKKNENTFKINLLPYQEGKNLFIKRDFFRFSDNWYDAELLYLHTINYQFVERTLGS